MATRRPLVSISGQIQQLPSGDTVEGTPGSLVTTGTKTANYNAAAFDFIPCDTSGGSFTVTLPSGADTDSVIGIILTAEGTTTKLTITASGSGAAIVAGKMPVISSVSLELYVVGDTVTLRHVGSNVWVAEAERIKPHNTEMVGSTSAAQTIGAGGAARIQFSTASPNVGSIADLTNHRATARRAGRYQVSCFLNMPTMTTSTIVQIIIRRNGTNVVFQQLFSQTSARPTISYTINLAATEYVEFWVFHNDGAGSRDTATATPCRMSVQEII